MHLSQQGGGGGMGGGTGQNLIIQKLIIQTGKCILPVQKY